MSAVKQLSEYVRTLDKAIEHTKAGKRSKANLILSNFFFKEGAVTLENMQDALKLTIHHRHYVESEQTVRSYIAQCLYLVIQLPDTGNIYVRKESNDSFVIVEKS